ncbi:MAG: hypothetical protein FWE82_08515 [Defluviitaleaceae bacterium]|nr:hypothetical protein [Defluviitaleaceae bacterium]
MDEKLIRDIKSLIFQKKRSTGFKLNAAKAAHAQVETEIWQLENNLIGANPALLSFAK